MKTALLFFATPILRTAILDAVKDTSENFSYFALSIVVRPTFISANVSFRKNGKNRISCRNYEDGSKILNVTHKRFFFLSSALLFAF